MGLSKLSVDDPKFNNKGRFCESERKVLLKKLETCLGVDSFMERGLFVDEKGALYCEYLNSFLN